MDRPRIIGASLLIGMLLTVGIVNALAQQADGSVEAALTCFEQLHGKGVTRNTCESGVVSARVIVRYPEQYPPAVYDAAVNGLERLALTSNDDRVRTAAVMALVNMGNGAADPPIAGTVDRLSSIFWQSNDKGLRASILRVMCCQAERAQAVEFLKAAAREDRPEDRGSHWPPAHWALSTLALMGPDGQAALASLYAEDSVKNPVARAYMEYLSKHSFQEPSATKQHDRSPSASS